MSPANAAKIDDPEKQSSLLLTSQPSLPTEDQHAHGKHNSNPNMSRIQHLCFIILLLVLLTISVVSAASNSRHPRAVIGSAEEKVRFQDLLNSIDPWSLHDVLHTHLKDKFQDGVYQEDKAAMRVVHQSNAEVAYSLLDLAKRQVPTSNGTGVTVIATTQVQVTTAITTTVTGDAPTQPTTQPPAAATTTNAPAPGTTTVAPAPETITTTQPASPATTSIVPTSAVPSPPSSSTTAPAQPATSNPATTVIAPPVSVTSTQVIPAQTTTVSSAGGTSVVVIPASVATITAPANSASAAPITTSTVNAAGSTVVIVSSQSVNAAGSTIVVVVSSTQTTPGVSTVTQTAAPVTTDSLTTDSLTTDFSTTAPIVPASSSLADITSTIGTIVVQTISGSTSNRVTAGTSSSSSRRTSTARSITQDIIYTTTFADGTKSTITSITVVPADQVQQTGTGSTKTGPAGTVQTNFAAAIPGISVKMGGILGALGVIVVGAL